MAWIRAFSRSKPLGRAILHTFPFSSGLYCTDHSRISQWYSAGRVRAFSRKAWGGQHEPERLVGMSGIVAASLGDRAWAGMHQQGQNEIVDNRQDLGCIPGLQPSSIFLKGDIPPVM